MHASKIQDQVEPVVGIYKGPVRGKHKKPDFVFERESGPIKILGFSALESFLKQVDIGTKVYVKYIRTDKFLTNSGEERSLIVIDARVL